ncbi:glycosyltransferase family 4 protein [Endomicrobium proavitum]|uniref:UDP-N-acetylmuramyl pentapeptide phosphotransferase/UDP-N-acetylglucosamine-1-phosphate transferase n=1 Tax=Endomicrobium proavitum TaxID=1408281 RepID=A0A0G3WHN8_9BACT|nr:MraY family glycosyltransferase [Endomicrobium proavitum]AKL97848.1 UDP-N-acetylmuramyl pentapeptide phosphotransferase/UDP-N-acetylglucosamine-1-phosphate transferase [Endomicrobium proavitum]
MSSEILYLTAFVTALIISILATPLCRLLAKKLNVLDNPVTAVKTHKISTPYLGGVAIALGWLVSLFAVRYSTSFPDGTLRSLRGIIIGALVVLFLGLIDDAKFKGLGFKSKLFIQFAAACIVVFGFDIRINFISIYWLSCLVSIFWIVGITNAFNIIDIMDGLSSGIATIAALAFLFISLPTEQIYVNFCAIALAGALIGFMPFNLSKSKKIFMGDTGSLFIGFILASLAMGTEYTSIHEIGLFAPLFILAVPIYETFLVSWFRIRKGKLPFMGSKDHYALRLEMMGLKRKNILLITYAVCIALAVCAYFFTKLSGVYALMLFLFIFICLWAASIKLASVKVE